MVIHNHLHGIYNYMHNTFFCNVTISTTVYITVYSYMHNKKLTHHPLLHADHWFLHDNTVAIYTYTHNTGLLFIAISHIRLFTYVHTCFIWKSVLGNEPRGDLNLD